MRNDIPANLAIFDAISYYCESKVKGYAIFRLTEAHINLGPAIGQKENIFQQQKGFSPGTTKITNKL